MKWSRRDFPFLLPALAAAQTTVRKEPLPSNAFRYEDMEARKSGTIVARQILTGGTHTGYMIDLHETELPAGQAPHAPPHGRDDARCCWFARACSRSQSAGARHNSARVRWPISPRTRSTDGA